MFCRNCGKECSANDKFCQGCGANLHSNEPIANTTAVNATAPSATVVTEANAPLPQQANKKPGKVAAIILLVIGGLFTIIELLALLDIGGAGDSFSAGALVWGVLFCAYGGLLLTKEIKKYGWGIGAAITLSALVGALNPFDKSALLGCLVFTIVFAALLIKANIKK